MSAQVSGTEGKRECFKNPCFYWRLFEGVLEDLAASEYIDCRLRMQDCLLPCSSRGKSIHGQALYQTFFLEKCENQIVILYHSSDKGDMTANLFFQHAAVQMTKQLL